MKKTLLVFRYLLSVHILALVILSFFRFILYFTNHTLATDVANKGTLLFKAMLLGVQFDNVIACYGVALPLVVLSLFALCNKMPKILVRVFNIYFIIFYTIVFAVSAADIPYFSYFYTHMGGSIFNWVLGFGDTTAGMIFGESSYYLFIALFIISIVLFSVAITYFGRILLKSENTKLKGKSYAVYIPFTIIVWGLCFLGIRGGLERYPLKVNSAYFCNNSFFNQLGINPSFFLLKNILFLAKNPDKIRDKADGILIHYVQQELGIAKPFNEKNPISRWVEAEGDAKKMNVVIILMESMSSEYLKKEYKGRQLTPFLNQLISKSYYFDNFYSSGVHTNNGITSSLYGYMPQFDKPMMGVTVDKFTGLPVNLRNAGYQTSFFLTSNPRFDNMNAFLLENGIEQIYSQFDYPQDKIVNNYGVPDKYLFEYGLDKLKEMSKKQPFFSTFMTITNHPPYTVPSEYEDKGETIDECAVVYADDCLKEFMEKVSKEDYYKNTIFILLGDHGRPIGKQPYEMALSCNHIPLIIYSPLFEDAPKTFSQLGGQIDIFPTVMSMLGISYENNSMGIDLFRESRPFIYFVSDNHLGCVNKEYFYVHDPITKNDRLYDYRTQSEADVKRVHPALLDSMKRYSISMMVTSNHIIKNNLIGLEQIK